MTATTFHISGGWRPRPNQIVTLNGRRARLIVNTHPKVSMEDWWLVQFLDTKDVEAVDLTTVSSIIFGAI